MSKKNRLRADLHPSFKGHPHIKKVRDYLKYTAAEKTLNKIFGANISVIQNEWEESNTDASWKYEGETSLTSLDAALKFCKVDLNIWEVERHLFNSWDVTSTNFGKRTNYQVKVWFKRIEKIIIQIPKLEPLTYTSSGDSEMWVIAGCFHRPFHNQKLWDKFLTFLHDYRTKITGIIINGDYLDLRSLSSYDDYLPPGINLSSEYSDGLKGILEIKQALGKQYSRIKRVFHYGNHEARYNRECKSKSKYGKALMSPIEALRLVENGYKLQTDWKEGYTRLGIDLDVFHGIYYGQHNASKHLAMIPNRSGVYNHTHSWQSFDNGSHTAYNIGWMGDPDSKGFKYSDRFKKSKWRNGFATTYLDEVGNHSVHPIRCMNGNFFFGGKVY